jgi:ABC-type lipoprotein export system ATPase subunit
MKLLGTEYEEYAVINAPPGSGKSTFLLKCYPRGQLYATELSVE